MESKLFVRGQTLGEVLEGFLHVIHIPERMCAHIRVLTAVYPPYSLDNEAALHVLGVSRFDTPSTIEEAYDLQVSDDLANCPVYLGALTKLSHVFVPGREVLQIKAATEKSLDRYTISVYAVRNSH